MVMPRGPRTAESPMPDSWSSAGVCREDTIISLKNMRKEIEGTNLDGASGDNDLPPRVGGVACSTAARGRKFNARRGEWNASCVSPVDFGDLYYAWIVSLVVIDKERKAARLTRCLVSVNQFVRILSTGVK